MKASRILSQKRKHVGVSAMLAIVVVFVMISLEGICLQCYAKEGLIETSVEFLPSGESYTDADGNVWARSYELFVIIRGKITNDLQKRLAVQSEEQEDMTELILSVSQNELIAVAHTSVSENGCYKILEIMSEGELTQERGQVQVNRIDREGPKITCVTEPDKWIEGTLTIHVDAHDAGCGLAQQAYSFDGGKTFESGCDFMLKKSATVDVVVRDALGNASMQQLFLKKQPIVIDDKKKTVKEQNINLRDSEKNSQMDVADEDIKEPSISNQPLFEEAVAMIHMNEQRQEEPDEKSAQSNIIQSDSREKINTDVIQRGQYVALPGEDVTHVNTLTQLPSKNNVTQNEKRSIFNKPVMRTVITITIPFLALLFFCFVNLILLKRFHTAEIYGTTKKGEREKLGEARLAKKEHQQILVIPDELLLRKQYDTYEIQVSYLYAKRFEEAALYVSYLGKTTELVIAPKIPFIV